MQEAGSNLFDLIVALIQLFLQTINRTEICRSEKFALNGETSLNKKLASSLHRRQQIFFFIFYLTQQKQNSVSMCCANCSVMWSDSFIFAIFLLKKKPTAKYWVDISSEWTFEIQNLLGSVDRFFFPKTTTDTRWCQEGASWDEN